MKNQLKQIAYFAIKKGANYSLIRSTFNQRNYVIFMSYEDIFVRINYARLRIILFLARIGSARFRESSALGAQVAGANPVAPTLKNQVILLVTQTRFFIAKI